jgi:hypothetical protein
MSDTVKDENLEQVSGGVVTGQKPTDACCVCGRRRGFYLGFAYVRDGEEANEVRYKNGKACEYCVQADLAPYLRDGYRLAYWIQ